MNYFLRLKQFLIVMMFSAFLTSAHAAPFKQGDMSFSLLLGSGQAFNDNYTIVGAGIGYYVLDGLRLGIEGESWMGGDISISKYSPQIQYVFSRNEQIKPYLGVFYRKTSITGFDDLDSAGGRAGVYLSTKGNYYMSIGVAHESYLDCDESIYVSCSDTYPELTITFSL